MQLKKLRVVFSILFFFLTSANLRRMERPRREHCSDFHWIFNYNFCEFSKCNKGTVNPYKHLRGRGGGAPWTQQCATTNIITAPPTSPAIAPQCTGKARK